MLDQPTKIKLLYPRSSIPIILESRKVFFYDFILIFRKRPCLPITLHGDGFLNAQTSME